MALVSDITIPDSLDGEHWAHIEGYGGRYYVSDLGRLYSDGSNGGRRGIIKHGDNGRGYRMAIFCVNSVKKPVYVHRLVAEAFVSGKTNDRCHVNHIDGNRSNNNATNLEWVTRSENMRHSVDVLGHKTAKGFISACRKLTDEQVRAIRRDTRPEKVVAADYGVGHTTIFNVRHRLVYKDVV